MTLKIAVIQRFLPSVSRGGAGHFTHGLCNALIARGHSVTVFSQDPAPADAHYYVITLPKSSSKLMARLASLVFPFQVARLSFPEFDLLHAQGDDQLLPKRRVPPVVRTLHGSALAEAVHNGLQLGSMKRFLMHLYFYLCELVADLRAEAVAAVSEDTRRYFPRIHVVIPNGVDLELFRPGTEARSPKPALLYVGEMTSRKRGRLLLKIFQEKLLPRLPEAELWLVCPEQVQAKGVRWFSSMDPVALAGLYRRAWVFCLPSSYEGFGRPYIEALAAGLPVVATLNPGAIEILDRGRYGFVVSDVELAETLYRLLTQEFLRSDYGRRGLERAQAYGWPKIAERYERLYETVLQKRKNRGRSL